MSNVNEEEEMITEEYHDKPAAAWKLDELPTEVLEMILCHVRAADLVAVAKSCSRLEKVVRGGRLWRRHTLQLANDDDRFLSQVQLAHEVHELQIRVDTSLAKAATCYEGPTPRARTLDIKLSQLRTRLGVALLGKYGQKARHVRLDLTHAPSESPRCHADLFQLLSTLSSVESVAVRLDRLEDIVLLNSMNVRIIDIDIRPLERSLFHFRHVDETVEAVAKLISLHSSYLQALRLPLTYDHSLSRVVESCKGLRTLACNVWTLPRIEHFTNLGTLSVFSPLSNNMTNEEVLDLISLVGRARDVLKNLKEVRFVKSDRYVNESSAEASVDILLALCRNLQVLEVQWDVEDIRVFCSFLQSNAESLREITLHGELLTPHHYYFLASCPNLEILDLRDHKKNTTDARKTNRKLAVFPEFRTALTVLQKSLPKLTVIFEEDVEERHDWNSCSYLDENTEASARRDESQDFFVDTRTLFREDLRRLFSHIEYSIHWDYHNFFFDQIPAPWQWATLDSSIWSNEDFIKILGMAPALGLLDCRNREELSPGKKGRQWFNAVACGPTGIEALRIRAVLVSAHLWKQMAPALFRIGKSLRCLELDFRGRPGRDWRTVLDVVRILPNLEELILRGSFEGNRPVLYWLDGLECSLTRLDLRDCSMLNIAQMPAFAELLREILRNHQGTLRAVALPTLSPQLAAPVLRTLSELRNLSEVALHANEVESVRPLTSLSHLELYGDRSSRNTISLDTLASNLRNMCDTFEGVERLTLPVGLIKSQLVQEAVFDVFPRLRTLEVTNHRRKQKVCARGPQCRNMFKRLC